VTIRRSALYQERLKELCVNCNVRYFKPIIDIKTRWNSTYDMIEAAIELKQPFNLLSVYPELSNTLIAANEWDTMEELLYLLRVSLENYFC
jgi:hypothetical protein